MRQQNIYLIFRVCITKRDRSEWDTICTQYGANTIQTNRMWCVCGFFFFFFFSFCYYCCCRLLKGWNCERLPEPRPPSCARTLMDVGFGPTVGSFTFGKIVIVKYILLLYGLYFIVCNQTKIQLDEPERNGSLLIFRGFII